MINWWLKNELRNRFVFVLCYELSSQYFILFPSIHACTRTVFVQEVVVLNNRVHNRVLSFEKVNQFQFWVIFHVFEWPNADKESSWTANFNVLGKAIQTFLKAIHLSSYVRPYIIQFSHKSMKKSKKHDFLSRHQLEKKSIVDVCM